METGVNVPTIIATMEQTVLKVCLFNHMCAFHLDE